MALKYQIIPVTPFEQNCSLIWCEKTADAIVVDPGGDIYKIKQYLVDNKLHLKNIILTHGHLDHVGGAKQLAQEFGVLILGPQIEDKFWFDALEMQCQQFGFPPISSFLPDRWLTTSDQIKVGDEILTILHVPGHTPGHIALYSESAELAFVGDVLFKNGVGRSDFPQGNAQILIDSIKNRLLSLGDEITFIPGHGPISTFGAERKSNPFLNC